MHEDDDDLRNVLKELISPAVSPFINFYCDKCFSSLEDYGDEPLIFGENNFDDDSFPDLILCGKCGADHFAEEDYHSAQLRNKFENTIFESECNERNIETQTIQKIAHEMFEALALGLSEREFLKEHPHLTYQDILACYSFAAQRI